MVTKNYRLTKDDVLFLYEELEAVQEGNRERVSVDYTREVLHKAGILFKEWKKILDKQPVTDRGDQLEVEKMENMLNSMTKEVVTGNLFTERGYLTLINILLRVATNIGEDAMEDTNVLEEVRDTSRLELSRNDINTRLSSI